VPPRSPHLLKPDTTYPLMVQQGHCQVHKFKTSQQFSTTAVTKQ